MVWAVVSSRQEGLEPERAAGTGVGWQVGDEMMEKMPEAQCAGLSYLFEVYALP